MVNILGDEQDAKGKEFRTLDAYEAAGEAPPAYDSLQPDRRRFPPTSGSSSGPTHAQSSSTSLGFPRFLRPSPGASSLPATPSGSRPVKSTLTAKSQNAVRETVRGLLRDLVRGGPAVRLNSESVDSTLDSCSNTCEVHQLSLARLLQERFIEGHSPLYWVIVMRPPVKRSGKSAETEEDAFIMSMAVRAVPFSPEFLPELRSACLALTDNTLYRRIQALPGALSLSETDRMLLNSTVQAPVESFENASSSMDKKNARVKEFKSSHMFEDSAEVYEASGSADEFSVRLEIKMFQRRMKVSNGLSIEFITKGRIWMLTFFIVPSLPEAGEARPTTSAVTSIPSPQAVAVSRAIFDSVRARGYPAGSWAASLTLLDDSPETPVDARIAVHDASLLTHMYSSSSSPNVMSSSRAGPSSFRETLSSGWSQLKADFRSEPTTPMASRNNYQPQSKPVITLSFGQNATGPLLALPSSPPLDPSRPFLYPGEDDLSDTARRRLLRNAATMRAPQPKEPKQPNCFSALFGTDTYVESLTRERYASRLLFGSFQSPENKRFSELMYDNSSYIAPDGTLHAVLQVNLSPRPPARPFRRRGYDDDCIIC